ncbi:MAG: hypothetical protein HN531_15825 [Opitutae bacterium]|jgi:hypothetical protein|nr:hypothetical protein [Opitutae bacterium]
MNETEQLEKALESLRPKEPSADFERRVEEALGDSGQLAVSRLPELGSESRCASAPRGNLFSIPAFFLLGAAALVALFFSFPSSPSLQSGTGSGIPADTIELPTPDMAQDSHAVADDSPINGVSTEELSAMSGAGWEEPQAQQIPIDFSDEGIVERPGMSPARQYRYHYLDETIWVNPGTNTFIRSSVPRQETLLIGLEPF